MNSSKNGIVFLSVPESLRGRVEAESGGNFSIDPSIPIPVELPPGEKDLDLENLSWEMILSGMIRVVSENPGGEDADYYRRFVLAVKPDILGEFSEAAILKARNGDYDMALEIFAALKGLFPASPVVLLNTALVLEDRADALERAGREEEAEAENERAHGVYKEVLALDPPFPNALFNGAFFFMKRRNFDKAREYFSKYIPLSDDPEKKDRAQKIVREIETRSLDDEIFREAYDFIRMGNETEGINKARNFLERHPDVWNGWFILGWGLRRLERWEDAAAAFRKAIELGGDNADTRNELAICLMETNDLKGARKELEAALSEEPENVKIISNLGILALKNGDDAEAAAFFRTVLELEPEDPVALQYLSRFDD
ncbi:tetratricopeptide repeat protein [Breznakiella homolactica]|uniref:tetratricopeptide repeat protein n=1 Tax=Breznakiella homolactica TaxID=2798577 RepID=UPI001CBA5E5E|nr:tetratricopeptide repeat protein [Breznakiella homolactica]